MIGLFQETPQNEFKIITWEQGLMPYQPPIEPLHREREIRVIANALKPILDGKQPNNLFIYGNPGNGKTTCLKHVIEELEKRTKRVETVYVNCREHSTRMAVYSLIVQALGEILPRRGLATDEVFSRITEVIQKTGKQVLVVLDNFEGLFFNKEQNILFDLAKTHNDKPLFVVICVSNEPKLCANPSWLAKNSLYLTKLEFRDYNEVEITDILERRARQSLAYNSWSEEVIRACSAKAASANGDMKVALECLWKAAKNTEQSNLKQITLEDVETADKNNWQETRQKSSEQTAVTNEEQIILDVLKNGEKTSSELYSLCTSKLKRSKRQIRNYLQNLDTKQLIVITRVATNNWLKAKTIKLRE